MADFVPGLELGERFYTEAANQYYMTGIPPELEGELKGAEKDLIVQAGQALTSEQLLLVRKILSGVARAGERWGRRKIAAMLTGKTDELPEALVSLSTTGLLGEHDPKLIEKWIDALLGSGSLISSISSGASASE